MSRSHKLRFISRDDVIALGGMDMSMVVTEVELAFLAWEKGDVLQPTKTTLKYLDKHERYGGLVNVLPAAIRDVRGEIYGVKQLGAMPSNVSQGLPRATGLITLFDGNTKTPIAVMDSQVVSAMRTGAVSAIAARLLCRPDTKHLGLIGSGVNMRTQLVGLLYALPRVEVVTVYSRGDSKHDFVAKMSQRFPQVDFRVANSSNKAVEHAEVVVTCVANADMPVVAAADLDRPGLTVFNIGCLENEPKLLATMDMVVADYWEHSKHRGVQTHAVAYQQGIINDKSVVDLKDILAGISRGRTSPRQRIFFAPTGLGVEDVAVARELLARAEASNVGQIMELWRDEPWI